MGRRRSQILGIRRQEDCQPKPMDFDPELTLRIRSLALLGNYYYPNVKPWISVC